MRGSEEKRAGTQATKFFVCTYDIFSIKRVTQKFHVATTTARKCTKKIAADAKIFFCQLHLLVFVSWLIFFLAVLIAVDV